MGVAMANQKLNKVKINKVAVVVAAIPYFALGYPWFAFFRDAWFYGGGLTVEQLLEGPSYAVAFGVAIGGALVTSYVLALLMAKTGTRTAVGGMGIAALGWLGFTAAVMATQYTFEARSPGYFGVTAGYPLLALLIMGAILGAWPGRSKHED